MRRSPGTKGRQRRDQILRLLRDSDRIEVADLKDRLGVSDMTIRRDLATLQEDGAVRRVHGGAVSVERSPFETRTVKLVAEKRRIAGRAAELIGAGDTVAIDTGTTAHYVARALSGRSDLMVATNSINVAAEFRHSSSKVLLTGGVLMPELCLVGSLATETLRQLHVNTFILGCGGLTPERGLTYFDIDETEVRRTMMGIADRVVVVMDHSKFGYTETVSLATLDDVDVIVTDTEPPPPYPALCRRHDTQLVIAS